MQNQNQQYNINDLSWLDCIGDLQNNFSQKNVSQSLFNQLQYENSKAKTFKKEIIQQISSPSPFQNQQKDKNCKIPNQQIENMKRVRQHVTMTQQVTPENNSSSNQASVSDMLSRWKKSYLNGQQKKDSKQCFYSKAYRERKKQQFKLLQQENQFLKKKISQLQFRLRQKQLEIHRRKYPIPSQLQFSIEGLNAQFVKKATIHIQDVLKTPGQVQKATFNGKDDFYQNFARDYDKLGFGGSDKKQFLNYHMNQLIDGLMKDSEKYLMVLFSNISNYKDLKPIQQYEPINQAFVYIMQDFTEDRTKRLKFMAMKLYPLYGQYQKLCANLVKDFEKILCCCDKIHNFIKQTYLTTSRDFGYKRIKLQTWFQFHKYGKLMRKLRSQWMQLIKNQKSENDQTTKSSYPTKRSKKNKSLGK